MPGKNTSPSRNPPSASLESETSAFRDALLSWFLDVARDLPWRRTRNPYVIWISEVILQQTRVEQAIPYFERFIREFPDVFQLASASIDDVLKIWEGLGYYSRARNLHRAAQEIVDRHEGRIPSSRDDLLALPGIGSYTAAAILSMAFDQGFGVLDGNVVRVLARLTGLAEDSRKSRVRRSLQQLADRLTNPTEPGKHHEAMMELGATICTPRSPKCRVCPVAAFCQAVHEGNPEAYPVRSPRKRIPHYDIAVGVISNEAGEMLIQRRAEDGLLGGLWELPGGKRQQHETLEEACRRELREELGIEVEVGPKITSIPHAYSHFRITLHAFHCSLVSGTPFSTQSLPVTWIVAEKMQDYAFPRANRKLIEQLFRP